MMYTHALVGHLLGFLSPTEPLLWGGHGNGGARLTTPLRRELRRMRATRMLAVLST